MEESTSVLQRSRFGPLVLVLIPLILVATFLLFWRLGVKPLENWDEGIHAEVTREMYRDGAWLSLSYRDGLYAAKPPLSFWLRSALFGVFGETEFAIRFWSALAGVATTVLLAFWAWQATKRTTFGLLVGLVFVFGRYTLFHAFRTGETDGLLVLFVVLALYAYWRSKDSTRWFLLFGAAVGLSMMTKSFAGLIPAIVVGLDLTLSKRWSAIGLRRIAQSVLIAAVIALPWHVIELIRHGSAFWNTYFGFHILERTSEVLYKNIVPWYWYVEIIFKRTFPFSAFVALALILSLRRLVVKRDPLDRLLLLWISVVVILFSFIQTKFDWYILPLYPALAFVLTRGFFELVDSSNWLTRWGHIAAFLGTMYLLPDGLAHEGILWKLTPYAYLPSAAVDSVVGRMSVAVVVTAAIVLGTFILMRLTTIHAPRLVATVLLVYFLALSFGWYVSYLRHLPIDSPLKAIAATVQQLDTEHLDVVGVDLLRQPAGYFYLRRVPNLTLSEVRDHSRLGSALILTTTAPAFASVRELGNAILERDRYVLIEPRPLLTE